ncbi:MAG: TetM/TetW/TetO/TetS family tetracycline resistance ribosomal protection protein [Eubacteriales bacterium]|nr:TetM/TetW/TetO/TetS family tetracycline resistance ribosomal protection protein [Eubacteriales bacterium]
MKSSLILGILAHVDAGKTTLSEALLYVGGARRTLGRVDHGDACLDTHQLERARGITIFSKQARLETATREITLVDTPGHVDFSAEAERTLGVLDCAVLVISGTDSVQAHTLTLWRLLERYRVPTFLFVSKMDLAGADRGRVLGDLQRQLSPGCVDFSASPEEIAENAALLDEALLENYLETGTVTPGNLRGLIARRRLFPCCFGSGLRLDGVADFLAVLDRFAPEQTYGEAFAARVYKISRDPQGSRLTWLKVTGGSLKVRSAICYVNPKGEQKEEKALQLRLYTADKFTAPEEIFAGQTAAVTGLSETFAGQALGAEPNPLAPALEPVMTYRVNLPQGADPATVMPKLRQLEEEDPQLHLLWENGQIHVQMMGKVQLEIFRSLVSQRFGLDIQLDDRRIFYKETILDTVEGVGHFEPLRHYAECHLLLEPLPRGRGMEFATVCPTDVLDAGYQRLILTHLEEKVHRGVLTGAPITDMKITLLVGKAHLKHTEGGDFRQATYRAVRQGLMQAKSQLLEPWYDFALTLPTEQVGRAITDIRTMGGEFDPPETQGGLSTLRGQVPAAEVRDYADTVAAYTQGRGRLQLSLHGYAPCHNQQAVVEALGYDPCADLDNTPDSVFCAHGAGFTVKWDRVKEYMHLESGLKQARPPQLLSRNLALDEKELEKIMEREFGPVKTILYRPVTQPATEEVTIRPPKDRYIIVDGYNIIFAWEDLARTAKSDLDAARRQLCDALASYAGFTKTRLVVVFDGYKQKGNPGEKSRFHNIQVVYTREGETADAYIEALADTIGPSFAVRVATSDALVQLSSFRSGVLRMSARELREDVDRAREEMKEHFLK